MDIHQLHTSCIAIIHIDRHNTSNPHVQAPKPSKGPSTHLVQSGSLKDSRGTTHLSNRVHAQLRSTNIHRPNAKLSRNDGPNGGPAGAVVAYSHILEWYTALPGHLPQDRSSDGSGSVTLVSIVLEHYALRVYVLVEIIIFMGNCLHY